MFIFTVMFQKCLLVMKFDMKGVYDKASVTTRYLCYILLLQEFIRVLHEAVDLKKKTN